MKNLPAGKDRMTGDERLRREWERIKEELLAGVYTPQPVRNHDILMSRVTRKVKDQRVLRLIDRYLKAGMFEGGVATARSEGRRRAGHSRRCCPIFSLTNWTRNWRSGVIRSVATPMTAISMWPVGQAANG